MKKFLALSCTSLAFIFFLVSCQESAVERTRRWKPPVTPPTTPVVPPVTLPASSLDQLPKDVGGLHKPIVLGANASPYGYYLYTPSAYTPTGAKYPLLIFMHGSGEVGNSKTDPKALDKVLVNGPPKLIKAHTWAPKYPMIVASVQCHEGWWDAVKVKQFTEFLMKTYRVDTSRIYMTGLSMGGYGTWDQVTKYGRDSHVTAAVPISGGGIVYAVRTKRASYIPVWAFHGETDTTVDPGFDKQMWKDNHALVPKPAVLEKLTMYAATGHNAWSKTYDGTGIGHGEAGYDPFSMDIYTWMFQFKK